MNSLSSNGTKPHATKPPPPVIVGVRLKKTTAEVIRASTEPLGGGQRSKCKIISRASINNAVEVLTNAEPELNSMVVATYPETFPDDGRIVKAHYKALRQAITRKYGDYSHFTAIEYQKRGAPHFHQGLSLNLSGLGEITTLKRKKMTRRKPTFQTVKALQDWAFETWLDIVSKPDISYDGEPLNWSGLDDADVEAMRKAYYHYNAGFSWEVMRERDGAKRYFVKELTGLKLYQKTIPANFENPGRHFLYSQDMAFNDDDALTFILPEQKIRELLETSGWQYIPEQSKPLYKRLWNAASGLAVALIEAGYRPVSHTIETLRQYADHRSFKFSDLTEYEREAKDLVLEQMVKAAKHWQTIQRRLEREAYWERLLWHSPP